MTPRAQEFLRAALALLPDERADVAVELIASLDEPIADEAAAIQAAWTEEIERRALRVLAGESDGEPWEEVRERTSRRLTQFGSSRSLTNAAAQIIGTRA